MATSKKTVRLISTLLFGLVVNLYSSVSAGVLPGSECNLMNVLRITLANQPDIKLGRLDIDSARGKELASTGSFDSMLFANAHYEKVDSYLTDYERDLLGYDRDESESTGLEVGVRKTFQNGFKGEATFNSTMVDDQSGLDGYPTITRNLLEFSLTIPLLRGGGSAVTSELRQHRLSRMAAEQRHQKVISDSLTSTISAYWDYLESYQHLEIKKKIEQRTVVFHKNISRLIEYGERPASDSRQVSAQLASKRSERIEAERGLYVARQRLGMAMGVPFEQIEELGDPVDKFPVLATSDCLLQPNMVDLFDQACRRRGDYQATRLAEELVQIRLEKAKDSLKPLIELKLSANYEGVNEDNSFLDSVAEEESGPGGRIVISGEWPINNNSASGSKVSIAAQQRQARLRTLELGRAIRSNIAVASMDVCRIANATESTSESVELYNIAVDNEVKKLKRGLTTLINAISVEDKRNSAQEDLIVKQSALAKAIIRLRNETGTLVSFADGKGIFKLENIITLPVPESGGGRQ